MVIAPESLSSLNAKQLRELARDLIAQIANRDRSIHALDQHITLLDHTITRKDGEILYRQTKID